MAGANGAPTALAMGSVAIARSRDSKSDGMDLGFGQGRTDVDQRGMGLQWMKQITGWASEVDPFTRLNHDEQRLARHPQQLKLTGARRKVRSPCTGMDPNMRT